MCVSCMYSHSREPIVIRECVVSCLLILSGVETLKSFLVKKFFSFNVFYILMCICVM